MRVLIWGYNGWIGSKIVKLLEVRGHEAIKAESRLEDYFDICNELTKVTPDFVINCAGIIGVPNVDWCESHVQDTFLININGTVNLADACWRQNIHMTNYATGCIYNYNNRHPIGTKFKETDIPNFRGSKYSKSKALAEEILKEYDNVLTLRIRMPISEDLHSKSLITKLSKFAKVINIPNSVTVLPEILPITIDMMFARLTGIYNCTNPGAITHPQILGLYKKYIDPEHKWELFNEKEQSKILKAPRSNCELDTGKLEAFAPVNNAYDAIEEIMKNMIQ